MEKTMDEDVETSGRNMGFYRSAWAVGLSLEGLSISFKHLKLLLVLNAFQAHQKLF